MVEALLLVVIYLFCVLAGIIAMVLGMSWASFMEWLDDRGRV
jgi:hypothetical protein